MCGICFGSDFTDETKCPLVVNIKGSRYQQMNGTYILQGVDANDKVYYYHVGFSAEQYILSYEDDDKETPFWSIRGYKTAGPCPYWARLNYAESPINEEDWQMMKNEAPEEGPKIIVAATVQSVRYYKGNTLDIERELFDQCPKVLNKKSFIRKVKKLADKSEYK